MNKKGLREKPTIFQTTDLKELLRRFYTGQLEKQDTLENFTKPAILRAWCCDKEIKGQSLCDIVTHDDMIDVMDRIDLTVTLYQGCTLWGFYELTLQILIGFKEAGRGDLVLYPCPEAYHKDDALAVFGYFLGERLYGYGEPDLKLSDSDLAPYDADQRNALRRHYYQTFPQMLNFPRKEQPACDKESSNEKQTEQGLILIRSK